MSRRRYTSVDGRLAVVLTASVCRQIASICRRAGDVETGGILVGRYTKDLRCATVSRASRPPAGSWSTVTSFVRAVGRIQTWLDRLWSAGGGYYLGEWHWHPGSDPGPSSIDRVQLQRIAGDEGYNCPEPILLVVGGDPTETWRCSVTVFRRGRLPILLASARADNAARAG